MSTRADAKEKRVEIMEWRKECPSRLIRPYITLVLLKHGISDNTHAATQRVHSQAFLLMSEPKVDRTRSSFVPGVTRESRRRNVPPKMLTYK